MHKLLLTDILLVLLTILGSTYLYINQTVSLTYAIGLVMIYILAKFIGYMLLPYNQFEIFINHLADESKLNFLSGFEIFKTTLVTLLFIGFIFLNPAIWILESILIVMMRVWGIAFIKNKI
jgi:hypothetical protein